MSLIYHDGIVEMSPGLYDPHGHPRIFDPIVDEPIFSLNKYDGKAGLVSYTETALASGFVMVSAMPNEFIRRLNPDGGDTLILQYPISNRDRALATEAAIQTQSRMNMTYHLGLDRTQILLDDDNVLNHWVLEMNFHEAGKDVTALKVFGDESTGGQQIPIKHIPEIVHRWNAIYPDKPVILHLEDANVGAVLEAIHLLPNGSEIPVHIAHVSSQQELEAVIVAKEHGMNVTCEVTPHHLFATNDDGAQIGGFGCMKPTLKSADDMQFLRDNIRYIDIIASDCAPHRMSDKLSDKPAYGVTNHTVMTPLIFGAVEEDWLTLDDVYAKMVINPRKRFNLPLEDNTRTVFDLSERYVNAQEAEAHINPRYGQNIFPQLEKLGKRFNLVGKLLLAQSGDSAVASTENHAWRHEFKTSLRHLVKP